MKRLTTAASFTHLPRLVAKYVRSLGIESILVALNRNRKKRILLVDDESSLTKLCKLMLEQNDSFIVREENLGARAVATAREFRPDVIFLDLSLPDKNGPTIAAELQNDPKLRAVPIVFWSGSFKGKKDAVASWHGNRPALPKPFSTDELTQLASNPCPL